MKTYYCATCERIYKSSQPLETCGLCREAVTEEVPRFILPESTAQSSSGTLGKRAFREFEHVLNDFHHPNPQQEFEWPEELQAGTKKQRKLAPGKRASRASSSGSPAEEFAALNKPPFRRLQPEGKKPHTYTRSAKSKNHGKPFAPFKQKDKKGKGKVVSANVGGFENFLGKFNREPGQIERSLVEEKERWQGDGALYERLRVYSLERCKILIEKVTHDLPAEHAALVYFVNDYPCVHIDVGSYAKALTKGTDGEVEAFSEYMCYALNGYIDYFAHENGFTIACVCRSSFGFLVPTTAPTVESVRLSLGLAPRGYLGCVAQALARFLGHLDELKDGQALDTVPQSSFFAQKTHETYLSAKESQRQQTLNAKKKPVTPRQPFVYGNTSTVRDHLKHNISSEKGLMQEVTRTFGGGSHATQLCYGALAQKKGNGILAALQGSLARERWKIKGTTLSYVEPAYYRYEASAFSTTCPSSIADAEFTSTTNAIIEAAGMSVENGILSQDARWRATLFAAEDVYRQGISVYRKRVGETEEYEDGSDSEDEDEGLYHCKLISQNGMNAIGLALVFAQLWFKGEAKQTSASIFMEEMYFEAPHLLAINKWLQKTKQLAQSSILMGDLNHCVTSLARQSQHPIGEQSWRGKRVVIVDVTSSTLRRMREMVEKFKQDEPAVLLLVSSGLKHEQLGTDKNAYGTVRFFVAPKDKDNLGKYFTQLKLHPAYKKQPIVSHSVRRAFKSIGAVPTIDAILRSQESTST